MTYCLAFARLARVQCVAWGHPVTTGISTTDYFISSEQLESTGSESQYTETLVKLPTLNVYYDPPAQLPVPFSRERVGLTDGDALIVCPQSLYKFHPDFDEVLGEILRRVPRAKLAVLEGRHPTWGQRLRQRFARSIGDVADRIAFLPRMPTADFLGLLDAADVNLDTPHFGGGNTSYEAFALGSPIVTWPSGFLRGRITYAQYMQMGVTDLIARDMSHYVELAVRLATDKPWRDQMRATIRASSARLFRDAAAVRSLEVFFERAVAAT